MTFVVDVDEIVAANQSGLLGIHPTWRRIRLAEIASVQNGSPFSSALFSPVDGVPLIRIRDIRSTSTETRFRGSFSEEFLVRQGDILVGMDGDFNCALWNGPEGLLNQRVCRIKVHHEEYDERFLFHVLQPYLTAVNTSTSAMTVKHLSSLTLRELPLPLPPLNEQRRIVAKIEELFSDLDAAVAALTRAKANLKRYRAAVLKAAVEGKLTETWRAEHPDVEPATKLLERILAERRQKWEAAQQAKFAAAGKEPPKDWRSKYVEPKPPDTTGLPELPEGWQWLSAEQCCEYITKGTTPPPTELFEGTGEIPFIKIYNLTKDGSLDFAFKPTFIGNQTHRAGVMVRSRVVPGDVLMNIVGPPLGKVSVIPPTFAEWNLNQAIAILRPLTGFDRWWLCYLLLTDDILAWATRQAKATAGQFNLTLEIVRRLPLPLPPVAEQAQIVCEVAEKLSQIAAAQLAIEHGLIRAARLRQSILKQAFEGKLVPQDPQDEPASELLKRPRPPVALDGGGKLDRDRSSGSRYKERIMK